MSKLSWSHVRCSALNRARDVLSAANLSKPILGTNTYGSSSGAKMLHRVGLRSVGRSKHSNLVL